MSYTTLRRWTCNRCGEIEETPPTAAPSYWHGVAINTTTPDAAWDHKGWGRYHLCHQCRLDLTDFMADKS